MMGSFFDAFKLILHVALMTHCFGVSHFLCSCPLIERKFCVPIAYQHNLVENYVMCVV